MAQEIATQKKKRIKQISVKNLFGIFNYTILLHLEDRITIIHGPNGFGKTMILKLLDALFSQDNYILRTTPFNEFRINFDDDTSFWVIKGLQEDIEIKEEPLASQKITFCATGEQPFTPTHLQNFLVQFKHHSTRNTIIHHGLENTLSRTNSGEEQNISITTPEDLLNGFLLTDFQRAFHHEKEPDWLADTRKLVSVHLIETQRLLNVRKASQNPDKDDKEQPLVPTVKMHSEELADMVKTKLAEYASLSQLLDRTFPERAFNPTTAQSNRDENDLRLQLEALEEKRLNLTAAGLLGQGGRTAFALGDHVDESKKSMLSVYIEDTEKKLSVLDSLFEKLHLLTEIINKRFLYKEITIDKERGFVFITSKNTTLPLENLSSGEQHELVLFYELLFKVAPGSLILIDEPELSLHIVWQKQFLQDVQ
ncbi:MAG TPA: AAA family ATPase, partial [Ktedonobacteraceae bacterium]